MASLEQDPTDPTGVKDLTPRGNSEVITARQRKAKAALEMRIKNLNWDEIAEALGYPSGSHAQMATEKTWELGLLSEDSQEMMRRIAAGRLDEILSTCYPRALDPDHPEHLLYAREVRANLAQHAKLYGYEAPKQVVVDNPTAAQIQQFVDMASAGKTIDVEEADIFEAEVLEDELVES